MLKRFNLVTFLIYLLVHANIGCDIEAINGNFLNSSSTPASISFTYPKSKLLLATSSSSLSGFVPTISSGEIGYFEISPALPSGLNFNSQTGEIFGMPTNAFSEQTFIVTGFGEGDSQNFSLTLSSANGFKVNSFIDESDAVPGDGECLSASNLCTLRAGIEEVMALGGGKTLVLDNGTYQLNGVAPLAIDSDIGILGESREGVIIDGGGTVAANSSQRIFEIIAPAGAPTVILESLTVQNAKPPDSEGGAGVFMETSGGHLEVNDVSFLNNEVTYPSGLVVGGGAIMIDGDTTDSTFEIKNSYFEGNQAVTAGHGGAIFILNNILAGVIENSKFYQNISGGAGGAIALRNSSLLSVRKSLFQENSATANGGAIDFNIGTTSANISDSTFYQNQSAANGGAMYANSGAGSHHFITNCTFAFNMAATTGGVSGNSGTAYMDNNILFQNTLLDGTTVDNCGSAPVSVNGGNISNSTIADCGNFGAGSDQHSTDPLLNPLALNGGTWETLSLQAGSPARGTGESAVCTTNDQRGIARATNCDVGAVESSADN